MSENIKVLKFSGAKNDFELLDLLRFRYQMYANDISSLNGILIGYALANEKYKDEMRDFGSYLSDLESYNSSAISWSKFISRKAELLRFP